MKRFLLSVLLATAAIGAWAQNMFIPAGAGAFTVNNADGEALTYRIIDATARTVAFNYVPTTVVTLRIPATVVNPNDGQTYTVVHQDESSIEYCGSLRTLVQPNTITSMGGRIWYSCSNLDSIKLSDNLESILSTVSGFNQTMFATGIAAEHISFPNTLKHLGEFSLANGQHLKEILLENTQIDTLRYTIWNQRAVEKVTLPTTLRGASGGFLNGCAKLKEATLPEGMRSLMDDGLSYNDAIETITIPSTMRWMGDWGKGSPQLTRINLNPTTPPVATTYSSDPFDGANAALKLYVPIDYSKAYKTSSHNKWSAAANQDRYREETTTGASGYTTYYLENENFLVPAGCTAYIITGATQPTGWTTGDPYDATITSFPAGTILPAQTPFILYSGSAGANLVEYQAGVSGTEASVAGNLMVGTATDAVITAGTGEKLYVFSGTGNGTLGAGFYTQGNRAGKSISLKAHRAGLKLPASAAPAKGLRIDFSQATPYDGTTTGIAAVTPKAEQTNGETYDLTGRRVTNATKGIYIINGKKIIR